MGIIDEIYGGGPTLPQPPAPSYQMETYQYGPKPVGSIVDDVYSEYNQDPAYVDRISTPGDRWWDTIVAGSKNFVSSMAEGLAVLQESEPLYYTDEDRKVQDEIARSKGFKDRHEWNESLRVPGGPWENAHIISDWARDIANSEALEYDKRVHMNQTWLEKLAFTAPQVAGQAIVSVMSGGALSMPAMGFQIIGSSYSNNIASGATPENASRNAILSALMQMPLEQLGIGGATKFIPVKKEIFKRIKDIIEGGLVEGLTEFLQEYPDAWTNLMATEPDGDKLEQLLQTLKDPEVFKSALEAGSIGAVLGGGVSTVSNIYGAATGKPVDDDPIDMLNDDPRFRPTSKDKIDPNLIKRVTEGIVEAEAEPMLPAGPGMIAPDVEPGIAPDMAMGGQLGEMLMPEDITGDLSIVDQVYGEMIDEETLTEGEPDVATTRVQDRVPGNIWDLQGVDNTQLPSEESILASVERAMRADTKPKEKVDEKPDVPLEKMRSKPITKEPSMKDLEAAEEPKVTDDTRAEKELGLALEAKKPTPKKAKPEPEVETFDSFYESLPADKRLKILDLKKDTEMDEAERLGLAKAAIATLPKVKRAPKKSVKFIPRKGESVKPGNAVLRIDGVIYGPRHRHFDVIEYDLGGYDKFAVDMVGKNIEEGFLTTEGRYVDRDTAGKLAGTRGPLLSENLRRSVKLAAPPVADMTAALTGKKKPAKKQPKMPFKKDRLGTRPPISFDEWRADPDKRPDWANKKKFMPGAVGKMAEKINNIIEDDYVQWLTNEGYIERDADMFAEGDTRRSEIRQLERLSKRSVEAAQMAGESVEDVPTFSIKEAKPTDLSVTQKFLKGFFEKLGVKTVWYVAPEGSEADTANGMYDDYTGSLLINVNATAPTITLISHEAVHQIFEEHPDLRDKLIKAAKGYLSKKDVKKFMSEYEDFMLDMGAEVDPDVEFEEFWAYALGSLFQRQSFIRELAKQDYTMIEKVWNILSQIIDKMWSAFGTGTREAAIRTPFMHLQFFNDVAAVESLWAEVFMEYSERLRTFKDVADKYGMKSSGPKYQIKTPADLKKKMDNKLRQRRGRKEGNPKTYSYRILYWDLQEIVGMAGHRNKAKDFLNELDTWKGIVVTDAAKKSIGRVLDKFKDLKEWNKYKKMADIREMIASGAMPVFSKEYNAAVKKYGVGSGGLDVHAIKHRERFHIGKRTVYGPRRESDTVSKVKKNHPLFGEFTTEVVVDENGNTVIDSPILPQEIGAKDAMLDKLIKENSKFAGWYKEWNKFMNKFSTDVESAENVEKMIKVQAILSGQRGPQANQFIFKTIWNKLEQGVPLEPGSENKGKDGISESDAAKINAIYEGTDPAETLEERKALYGDKVGSYMSAALAPTKIGNVVIDRWMPRMWGYDITAGINDWHISAEVETEVTSDIYRAAQRNKMDVHEVQAALWFAMRPPDVQAETYSYAAAIKPSDYMPDTQFAGTMPTSLGSGINYGNTLLAEGEFILAADMEKKNYSTYSRGDVGARMEAHSEKNPYVPLVYFYEAKKGWKPEDVVKQKRHVRTVDLQQKRVYDAIGDVLGMWDKARDLVSRDTTRWGQAAPSRAEVTNALGNLIKQTGDYDGFAYKWSGDNRNVVLFDKAGVDFPATDVTVAVSDVVEGAEQLPQDVGQLQEMIGSRADRFDRSIKDTIAGYPELRITEYNPTIARFGDATSGQIEIGAMLRVHGPLNAVKAYGAELGLKNAQRVVFAIHGDGKPNGRLISAKVRGDLETQEDVAKHLMSKGFNDFNIGLKRTTGGLFVEQFFPDEDMHSDNVTAFADMLAEIAEPGMDIMDQMATSDIIGDFSPNEDDAIDSMVGELENYYGAQEAANVKEKAIKEREAHVDRIVRGEVGETFGGERADGKTEKDRRKKTGLRKSFKIDRDYIDRTKWHSDLLDFIKSNDFPIKSKKPLHLISLIDGAAKGNKWPVKPEEVYYSSINEYILSLGKEKTETSKVLARKATDEEADTYGYPWVVAIGDMVYGVGETAADARIDAAEFIGSDEIQKDELISFLETNHAGITETLFSNEEEELVGTQYFTYSLASKYDLSTSDVDYSELMVEFNHPDVGQRLRVKSGIAELGQIMEQLDPDSLDAYLREYEREYEKYRDGTMGRSEQEKFDEKYLYPNEFYDINWVRHILEMYRVKLQWPMLNGMKWAEKREAIGEIYDNLDDLFESLNDDEYLDHLAESGIQMPEMPTWFNQLMTARDKTIELLDLMKTKLVSGYKMPHWPNAANRNTFVTLRTMTFDAKNMGGAKEFTDKDKVFHIDEIQSDWNQEGRDEGYVTNGGWDSVKSMENTLLESYPKLTLKTTKKTKNGNPTEIELDLGKKRADDPSEKRIAKNFGGKWFLNAPIAQLPNNVKLEKIERIQYKFDKLTPEQRAEVGWGENRLEITEQGFQPVDDDGPITRDDMQGAIDQAGEIDDEGGYDVPSVYWVDEKELAKINAAFPESKKPEDAIDKRIVTQYRVVKKHKGKEIELAVANTPARAFRKAGANFDPVPDNPFKSTSSWAMKAFNRAVREAAENGYTVVTWTTGMQQIERWTDAVRQSVDEITYSKQVGSVHLERTRSFWEARYKTLIHKIDNMKEFPDLEYQRERYEETARDIKREHLKDGEWDAHKKDTVKIIETDTGSIIGHVDRGNAEYLHADRLDTGLSQDHKYRIVAKKDGVETFDQVIDDFMGTKLDVHGHEKKRYDLEKLLGKEIATQIRTSQERTGTISGDDLTIGGEGFKGFYDEIIPKAVKNFYGKNKWGKPRVSKVELPFSKLADDKFTSYYSVGNFEKVADVVYNDDGESVNEHNAPRVSEAVYGMYERLRKLKDKSIRTDEAQIAYNDIKPVKDSIDTLIASYGPDATLKYQRDGEVSSLIDLTLNDLSTRWDYIQRLMLDLGGFVGKPESGDPMYDMHWDEASGLVSKIGEWMKYLSEISTVVLKGKIDRVTEARLYDGPTLQWMEVNRDQGGFKKEMGALQNLAFGFSGLSHYLFDELQDIKKSLGYGLESVGDEEVWALEITDKMRKNAKELTRKFSKKQIPSAAAKVIEDKIGEAPVPVKTRVKEVMDDFFKTFKTRMLDRLDPIKQKFGEGMVYMLHRGLPGISSSIAAFLEHGKLRFDESGALTTDDVNKGFIKWFHGLKGDGNKFLYWRVAQRARKLLAEKREKLFTEDDIKAIEKWVGDRPTDSGYKSWMEINKEFNDFNNNILDLAEESGLISKQFKEYMQQDGFYIPFYRVLQDTDTRAEFTKSPFHNKQWISAQIKKLRGSEKKIGDPMSNMLKNWAHLISESVHNKARSSAFDQAIKMNLTTIEGEPLVEEIAAGDTYRWVPGKKQEDGIKVMFAYKKTGEPVLTFTRDGKPVYFRVNDAELFNALSMLDVKYFDENILKVFSGAKRALTFGATIGPAFRIANFIRDTLHTFVISKSFKPFWDSVQGFAKVYAKHPDYIKYLASGHAFAGSYIREGDRKSQQKFVDRVIKKESKSAAARILDTPKKLWDLWMDLGEASENAARVQIYSNVLKQGGSHLEAAFSARDVMDFNMRGNGAVLQALISTVPFLNARIQGLYRMGRAAKSDPRGFLLKGGLITMASLLLWYLNKDDERYKELEDFEKFQYYHFWIGDKHYRIPKPFETGVIFSTLFEAAADVMQGNEEFDHIIDALAHAFMETFSFNPLPQVARPILEQVMNKTFFSMRPIETQADMRKRRGDRYSPWTSETLRLLGDKLNVSPKRMEAMLRGYLSSFGMGILMVTDAAIDLADIYPERPTGEIGDLPGIGRFVKEASPARYTKYQTAFYDTLNEINEIQGTITHYNNIKDFDKARELATKKRSLLALRASMNQYRAQITKINNNIRMIWMDKTMHPDEKRKSINVWVTRKNEILKNVYNQLIKKEK